MTGTKQLSVRMPIDLVEEIARHGPAASYIVQAVREKVLRDQDTQIEASLRCLANDAAANDISDWMPKQKKAMQRVD